MWSYPVGVLLAGRQRGLEDESVGYGEEAVSGAVDFARSLLPGIVAAGVATEEEVDIDTLAERLHADTGPVGRISFWPTIVGAYATKPSELSP